MSRFSEKCDALMRESGLNPSKIAATSSLDRTTIQRMVTGKQLPNIEIVKQFCHEIRLSTPDKKHILELYKMESLGENTYRNRQCIRKLLRRLSTLEKKEDSNPLSYAGIDSVPINFFNNLSDSICETELNIRTVLESEFSSSADDGSHIYTNFPVDNDWLFHQLQLLHNKYPDADVPIDHLINFQMNINLSTHNLKVLSALLPLALSEELDYTPWYYYSKIQESDFSQLLFPYFFITPKYVLTISGDFKTSILHRDLNTLEAYTQEFERIQQISKPLIMSYTTPEAAFEYYVKNVPSIPINNADLYVLECQPCFSDMMNEKLLSELLHKNVNYLHMLPALKNLVSHFDGFEIWGAYTKEGLDSFCKTGKLTGQIGSFLSSFTIRERIFALTNFLNRDEQHHRHIISDILLPSHTGIEIYGNKSIHFIKIDDNLKVSLFIINESSICEAFLDFVSSLKDSEDTLSEEKSNQILQNAIKKLKHSIE